MVTWRNVGIHSYNDGDRAVKISPSFLLCLLCTLFM